jgi:hypothetical protein
MDIIKLLEEYRSSDHAKRLSLFMSYRELREQFSMIDQENSYEDFLIITFPWSKKRQIPQAA